jgi:ribosomal protein S18 acetylase RimI-like enzyme
MLLRLAQTSDLAAITALVRRAVPLMHAAGNFQWDDDYPSHAAFAHDIRRGELWVAESSAGVLAGVVAITTDQTPEYGHVGWDLAEPALAIHRLAVDPDYRGAGLAASLMQQAETIARERGITHLRVDTSAENTAIQRLFLRLGYAFAGQITIAYRPGLRVVCYAKRLTPLSSS